MQAQVRDRMTYKLESCSPELFLKVSSEYEKKVKEFHKQEENKKQKDNNRVRLEDADTRIY